MNVLCPSLRKEHAKLILLCRMLLYRFRLGLIEKLQILWMDPLASFRIRDGALLRIKSECTIGLFGPVDDFFAMNVVPPTSGMAQSLCFRQVCLAAPQSVLGPVASFNDKCVV